MQQSTHTKKIVKSGAYTILKGKHNWNEAYSYMAQ